MKQTQSQKKQINLSEHKKSPTFSICLLFYNHPELVEARLNEFREYLAHRHDVEFVLIDNGSEDKAVTNLAKTFVLENNKQATLIEFESNKGFSEGFNLGVNAIASGEILLLISNDVAISGPFLDDNYDFIVRQCNMGKLICHRKIEFDSGWNTFDMQTIPYGEGYFLMVSHDLWDFVNGFDLRYSPHDYEDVDFSMSVMTQCNKQPMDDDLIVAMPYLPLNHSSASTIGYSPQREAITLANRMKFAQKWGLPNVPERP